jgi:FtsZ-interacting cell division protein ZipA
MSTAAWIIVAIAIVVAIIVVLGLWMALRRRGLRSQFGPEYDRVADRRGSRWKADSELLARKQRREKLDIRPLPPEARERYGNSWQRVQAEFVDQPYGAVDEADQLVNTVMRERGYPMDNFEQHAADLSVDYPKLVDNYREAHAVATRQKSANTEDLRRAMLHYRALFEELLGGRDGQLPDERAEPSMRAPHVVPAEERRG